MKSMTIEDFYKIPRLNENLFEIENVQKVGFLSEQNWLDPRCKSWR